MSSVLKNKFKKYCNFLIEKERIFNYNMSCMRFFIRICEEL